MTKLNEGNDFVPSITAIFRVSSLCSQNTIIHNAFSLQEYQFELRMHQYQRYRFWKANFLDCSIKMAVRSGPAL